MLRPPSNPQLPARLPRQRAGGGRRPPNPVAGALMADRHTGTAAIEAAYRRTDLFERRRRLMDDWAPTSPTRVVEQAAAPVC